MIDENFPGDEAEAIADRALGSASRYFDVHMMQVSPFAWLSAVIPNSRLLETVPQVSAAALPSSGRVANGCGIDAATCRRSGLGEAVELFSSCEWGDERVVQASLGQLGDAAVPPEAINGFSISQIRERDVWHRAYASFDWRPLPCGHGPLHWIASKDATDGATVYLPADAVLIGRREAGDEAAVSIADSNGCAAGVTPDHARTSALLELIERDATGRWWYGRRRRGGLPDSILSGQPGLSDWLAARPRVTSLLDITSDIGIPVVAALSVGPDGSEPAVGFAARFCIADAALSATVEMLAVETSLPASGAVNDPVFSEWLSRGVSGLPPFGPVIEHSPTARPVHDGAAERLARCIKAVTAVGCRVFFVDLTRDVFGVPVFRAVVPELCHYKPRFGKRRLMAYDNRDLSSGRAGPRSPNPTPLLI